ncbi:hypothetical protein HYFRA_00010305 [Hymenoscyphus fraxineus]|uniref:alpha-glucosidase n=1 Tax=Hymenoscyphus fraxineus TaxID=746836 RepID=A0A9N9KX10_9HELO|nr:hypothetical protein HYFRA_00010305 [Hymenoscyphus fraxineus]
MSNMAFSWSFVSPSYLYLDFLYNHLASYHAFSSFPLLHNVWFWYWNLVLLSTFHLYLDDRRNMASKGPLILLGILATLLFTTWAQNPTITTTSFRPVFTVPADSDVSVPLLPNIRDPEAKNAQDVCPGYKAENVVRNEFGWTATLSLAGKACNVYGPDVDTLNLTVEYQSADRLHVQITPSHVDASNASWYILPDELIPQPKIDTDASTTSLSNDLEFVWDNEPSFHFSVLRKSTGDTLFSTTGSKIVFENQFIEFSSTLPENYNLYGLGEVIHGFRMGNNFTRTIYAADVGDPIDTNLYGSHAFYLDTRYYSINSSTGNLAYIANATDVEAEYVSYSHGVFLRNSHGQEILMKPENITWRTLGGDIDLFFYAGPSQEEVTKAYQVSTVGLPAMQQYFTFGYHQCRWGYANWSQLQEVVDNFARFEIPLENIWTDIDYMNQYRDFENDQNTFPYEEGRAFLKKIHDNGQHYIPIVDSAIYIPNPENASDAYPTFNRGNETQSFMLNPDGSLYIGSVWPGYTVFPDWIGAVLNGTGAFNWWTNELSTWYKEIPFDGIWIDMSEVSSFCVGSCGSKNVTLNPVHPPFSLPGEPGNVIYDYPEGFNLTNATEAASASAAKASQASSAAEVPAPISSSTSTEYLRTTPTPGVRSVEYPPYVINHVQGALDVHAVSPNATHHGSTQEYDYHNLFGHQILNATYHALLSVFPTKRPFIIGRSTFAGSGKWAGHWGGDNASIWAHLFFAIPQALSFSLFGIPMFGVDTCGFGGNSDEELCNRWMQASAFFPFYRNHNTLSANPQEPYVWASVIEASKKAMAIRYLLLPYMYTLFYQASTQGTTVMRALAWEFPHEPHLASADRQFMLGSSLLITPVLTQGATSVQGVFPGVGKGEIWYDWYSQSAVLAKPGENVTIEAPLGHIPVYIRGGSVLPTQEPGLTTRECRRNPWGLIVACGGEGSARGVLYVDDGESLVQDATLVVDFSLSGKTLYATARGTYKDTNPLANVTILGVQGGVSTVTFNGKALESGWSYNSTSKVLDVGQLNDVTANGAWASDWTLKWT